MNKSFTKIPDWVRSISDAGRLMAEMPSTSVGQLAPRLLISVPTGQFVSWILASGALQAPPKLGSSPVIGDKVTTWLNKKMQDVEVCECGSGEWEIRDGTSFKQGKIEVDQVPGVVLPSDIPNNRGSAQPTPEYRKKLSTLGKNYPTVYADQCGSPVVVVGDGREFLQSQRDDLVENVHTWLAERSAILLDQDTGQVSNPDRILFHPFMIFSPQVAQANLWLRAITPRLVIVTSWSNYRRMDPALFSGAPVVVLANRRVISNWNAIDETSEFQDFTTDFHSLDIGKFPNGVFARKFMTRAQTPLNQDEDDEIEI